jgi:hypothetical protein
LNNRGFTTDFEHKELYRLIRDGQPINDALTAYVREVIYAQYQDDTAVQSDKLLKDFFREISDPASGNVEGFPNAPESRDQVVDCFSRIIWQLSGYHSALNFSQVLSYQYCPFRPAGMRQPMPSLRSYKTDLAQDFNGAWLLTECKEVVDVSDLFVEDSLPTNAMMFGMQEIANILTSRTVQTLTSWLTPYGDFEISPATDRCKAAFNELKEKMIVIE